MMIGEKGKKKKKKKKKKEKDCAIALGKRNSHL